MIPHWDSTAITVAHWMIWKIRLMAPLLERLAVAGGGRDAAAQHVLAPLLILAALALVHVVQDVARLLVDVDAALGEFLADDFLAGIP